MDGPAPNPRRLAAALIVLAIVLRVAAVLVLQSHKTPHSTYEHGAIAANLLAGRGFSVRFLGADGPTSQQAPVYPLLVAAAYAVGGVETPQALLILELGQGVLAGVLVAAVMALGRAIAPGKPRVALAAGLLTAVHPTLVYAATHVQVACVAATLLAATLAWALRTGCTGRRRDAILTGALLAGLALTDPILALVAPAVVWAVATGHERRAAFRLVLAVGLTALAGIMPWTVRNALVHRELVFVKSTFGYAFWQGNCALSEGTDKVVRPSVEQALASRGAGLRGLNESLWAARHEAGYLDDIALTADDYRRLSVLTEPERSRRLFRRAVDDLRRDPSRYPRLCLRRLRYFLLFDETNPKTRNLVYRASHFGLTALAAVGLVIAPPPLRRRLAPTLLTAGLVTLFHALTIVSARFHLPLEPLMALWAAAGLARLPSAPRSDHIERVVLHDRLLGARRLDRTPACQA